MNVVVGSCLEETFANPETYAEESTFGLKSRTFLSETIPWTDELNDGISSRVTPASWE